MRTFTRELIAVLLIVNVLLCNYYVTECISENGYPDYCGWLLPESTPAIVERAI